MQSLYTLQGEWGQCYAAAVLEVQAVPPQLPPAFLSALLAGCDAPGASCEMLGLSGERRGQSRLLLVLRRSGRDPRNLSMDLKLRLNALKERLGRMDFEADVFDADRCLALTRDMTQRRDVTLCYPAENLRHVHCCYAPGGYDAVMPVDLSEIFDALAAHHGAGFSIQMNAAVMVPDEVRAIRDNLVWLARQSGKPDVPRATQAYNAALSMADIPLCFVNMTVWGGDNAMQLMLSSLRQRGFTTQMLPSELLPRCDYLADAPMALSGYTAEAAHVLERGLAVPRNCWRLTHLAPPRLLNALLFPRGDIAAPSGLKVNHAPRDDASLPPELTGDGIALGRRASDRRRVSIPIDRWSKHAVVVGMPGTGKTTFLFHLLMELYHHGIPFLAIEPSKTEYRALMEAIPTLKVYTPGHSSVAPLMFNPFLPPPGVPLEKFLPSLETAFLTAFSMHSPLDVIFPEVLRACYVRYGWRMDSTCESPGARPFGMRDFIAAFREEARQSGYDGESRANLESGGVYRFQSLLNSNNVLYDTDRPLPTEELLKRPVLIELDAIGNPEQKSLLLSLLLIQLNLVIRRDQSPDGRCKNAVLIDEAHVLLSPAQKMREARDADPTGRTVAFLQQMVLENRAYGTGMIFADQSPAKLGAEIVGNADIQLVFRLNNAADRRMLTENMNLPAQLANAIDDLPVGQCYLQTQGLHQPIRLVTPDIRGELGLNATLPDDAVRARYGAIHVPFVACKCECCKMSVRNAAEFIARSIADQHRADIADAQRAEAFIRNDMLTLLNKAVDGAPDRDQLFNCAKMFLVRRVEDMLAQAGR